MRHRCREPIVGSPFQADVAPDIAAGQRPGLRKWRASNSFDGVSTLCGATGGRARSGERGSEIQSAALSPCPTCGSGYPWLWSKIRGECGIGAGSSVPVQGCFVSLMPDSTRRGSSQHHAGMFMFKLKGKRVAALPAKKKLPRRHVWSLYGQRRADRPCREARSAPSACAIIDRVGAEVRFRPGLRTVADG